MGVVPAGIVKGYAPERPEDKMHRGVLQAPHDYHVMMVIFYSATGARVSDATVIAPVSGVGLAGSKRNLEPMEVAGAMTYGNFFDLPGRDIDTVGWRSGESGRRRRCHLSSRTITATIDRDCAG
jgi:hypothetical protein